MLGKFLALRGMLGSSVDSGGSGGGGSSGGSDFPIGDGNTHIWITLTEGRTSPMLCVGVSGTVTVDWGDGTEPDVLTGTSESSPQRTPNHQYAKPGDYVITLVADGEIGFLGNSGSTGGSFLLGVYADGNILDNTYRCRINKVECSANVTYIGPRAFYNCYGLTSIALSNGVRTIYTSAFEKCYCLTSVTIPDSVTTIATTAFGSCYGLTFAIIPSGVKTIDSYTFNCCYGARYFDFTRHTEVPKMSHTSAFTGIPADCEIRVPAALYDEWIAASNWANFASNIVAV